jgi:putative sterol carrier protein
MEVFSEEWARACCERLNASEAYRAAAAEWVGSIVLSMSADPAAGVPEERAVFIDAHQGACRGARLASGDDLAQATFLFSGDVATWRRLLGGELEPVVAVMQGRLRLLRGGLFTLARFAAAAREMVAAAAQVEGRFPDAAPAVS